MNTPHKPIPKLSLKFNLKPKFKAVCVAILFLLVVGGVSANFIFQNIQVQGASLAAVSSSTTKKSTKTQSSATPIVKVPQNPTIFQAPYISEVWYQSPNFNGNCNYSNFKCTPDVWIELHNPNLFSLDISGYSISYFDYNCSVKTNLCRPIIPVGTSIPANGYLVLQNKFGTVSNTTSALFGILDRLDVIHQKISLFTTANGIVDYQKTTLGLDILDENGSKLDTMVYSLPKNTTKEFRSLQRCKLNNSSNNDGNFKITQTQQSLGTIEKYQLFATPNTNYCETETAQTNIISLVVPTVIPPTIPLSSPVQNLAQNPSVASNQSQINPQTNPQANGLNSNSNSLNPIQNPVSDLVPNPVLEPALSLKSQENLQETTQKVINKNTENTNQIDTKLETKLSTNSFKSTINSSPNSNVNINQNNFQNSLNISSVAYKPFIDLVSLNNLNFVSDIQNSNINNYQNLAQINSQNQTQASYFTNFVKSGNIYNTQNQNTDQIFTLKNISNLAQNKSKPTNPSTQTIWYNSATSQKITYVDSNNQTQTTQVDSFSFRASFIYFNVIIILFFVGKIFKNNYKHTIELLQIGRAHV